MPAKRIPLPKRINPVTPPNFVPLTHAVIRAAAYAPLPTGPPFPQTSPLRKGQQHQDEDTTRHVINVPEVPHTKNQYRERGFKLLKRRGPDGVVRPKTDHILAFSRSGPPPHIRTRLTIMRTNKILEDLLNSGWLGSRQKLEETLGKDRGDEGCRRSHAPGRDPLDRRWISRVPPIVQHALRPQKKIIDPGPYLHLSKPYAPLGERNFSSSARGSKATPMELGVDGPGILDTEYHVLGTGIQGPTVPSKHSPKSSKKIQQATLSQLQPGTWFEMGEQRSIQSGVLLANNFPERGNLVALLPNGSVDLAQNSQVLYSFQNFIDPEEAQEAFWPSELSWSNYHLRNDSTAALAVSAAAAAANGSGDVSEHAVPPLVWEKRRKLARKLNLFQKGIENEMSKLTLFSNKSLHRLFRHPSPNKSRAWDLNDAAQVVFKVDRPEKITYVMRTALFRRIAECDRYLYLDWTSQDGNFIAQSETEARELDQVYEWMTATQPRSSQVVDFIRKARKIVKISRENPPSEKGGGKLELHKNLGLPSFSVNDLKILRFIQFAWSRHYLLPWQMNYTVSPVWKLLKATELYGELMDEEVIQEFMIELGIYAPWENMVPHYPESMILPFWSDRTDFLVNAENLGIHGKPNKKAKEPLAPDIRTSTLDEDSFYPRDPHEEIRYDFGQLVAFAVDSATASERDDAISVEGQPDGTTWIHIHVADPTSILHPNHHLAFKAQERLTSYYMPERRFPLFPDSFLKEHNLSLGDGEVPQKALTFSARVDSTSNILEYQIRPSLLRNLIKLTNEQVNEVLGLQSPPDGLKLVEPIGAVLPPAKDPPMPVKAKDPSVVAQLRHLLEVAAGLHQTSVRRGSLQFGRRSEEFSARFDPPELPLSFNLPKKPTLYATRPVVEITMPAERVDMNPRQSHIMITTLMQLGGAVASRFCTDRGIPAFYRTMSAPNETDMPAVEKLIALRDPETGYLPIQYSYPLLRYLSSAVVTSKPGPHWMLGLSGKDGECAMRVTSPLRRYEDIYMHWQIKNELLPASSPYRTKAGPLFDLKSVDLEASRQGRHLKAGLRGSRFASRHWLLYVIKRRLEQPPSVDPVTFELLRNVTAISAHDTSANLNDSLRETTVLLPDLDIVAVHKAETLAEVPPTDYTSFPVAIRALTMGARPKLIVGPR